LCVVLVLLFAQRKPHPCEVVGHAYADEPHRCDRTQVLLVECPQQAVLGMSTERRLMFVWKRGHYMNRSAAEAGGTCAARVVAAACRTMSSSFTVAKSLMKSVSAETGNVPHLLNLSANCA
jgi:hypothetical protein